MLTLHHPLLLLCPQPPSQHWLQGREELLQEREECLREHEEWLQGGLRKREVRLLERLQEGREESLQNRLQEHNELLQGRVELLQEHEERLREREERLQAREYRLQERLHDREERLQEREDRLLERLQEREDRLQQREDRLLEHLQEREERRQEDEDRLLARLQQCEGRLQERLQQHEGRLQEREERLREGAESMMPPPQVGPADPIPREAAAAAAAAAARADLAREAKAVDSVGASPSAQASPRSANGSASCADGLRASRGGSSSSGSGGGGSTGSGRGGERAVANGGTPGLESVRGAEAKGTSLLSTVAGDIFSAEQGARVEDAARSAFRYFAKEERHAAAPSSRPGARAERGTAEGTGLSYNRLYRRRGPSEYAAGWEACGPSSSGEASGRSLDDQKDASDSSSRTCTGATSAAAVATMATAAAPLGGLPLENEVADANGAEAYERVLAEVAMVDLDATRAESTEGPSENVGNEAIVRRIFCGEVPAFLQP